VTTANVKVHIDATMVQLAIAGEIDLANAATVEDEVLAAVDNKVTGVVVDLTDLMYIDSSGLRILFLLASRLDVLQITMKVVAPRGSPIRRVVELSGLDALVEMHP
jgi:stage II sporulation protein AA (anti-sigma F factor antagonist)